MIVRGKSIAQVAGELGMVPVGRRGRMAEALTAAEDLAQEFGYAADQGWTDGSQQSFTEDGADRAA